ncbi:MAG: hypothetical protein HUU57_04275 [Bdellovibrio sp.]|nr:hypothetical protein [Bdellovibrio sp.]
MKNGFKLLLFVFAFQMEIRVRAAAEVLQQPNQCLAEKAVSCALQAVQEGFHYQQYGLKIHAVKGSTLVRQSLKNWRLVRGALWVEQGPGFEVETVFGNITGQQGQFWVLEQDKKVLIRNVDADLKISLRDGKVLDLPQGFEVWISGLNTEGKSLYGMLRPVDLKDHLSLWSSLFQGSKDDFVEAVARLKYNWGDMAEKSSALYKSVVMRGIASQEERDLVLLRKKEREAEEIKKIKELYRARVFDR